MALIKLSSIGITNLSGKAGGSVFSRNRGGNYVKNFVVPVNSSTSAQEQVRADFAYFSAKWRLLTEAQRESWRQAKIDFPRTNVFGDTITLSGFNLYISLNQNLRTIGGTEISNAPAPAGVTPVDSISNLVFTGGATPVAGFKINFQALVGTTSSFVVESTVGTSTGKKNLSNLFKIIETQVQGATTPATVNCLGSYTAKFGTPQVGSKVGIRVKAINQTTGEAGAYISAQTIVN